MAESDSVPHFPSPPHASHASPAQKQYGDTRQTEDRELRVSGRNDEHSSGGLWLLESGFLRERRTEQNESSVLSNDDPPNE